MPTPDALAAVLTNLTGEALLDCWRAGALGPWEEAEVEAVLLDGCRTPGAMAAALDDVAAEMRGEVRRLAACGGIADGKLAIERAVMVSGNPEFWAATPFNPDTGDLGVAWSYDGGAAPYFGRVGGACCTIRGHVALDQVDWAHSALLRAIKEGQEEARLRPTARVTILGISGPDGRELGCVPVGQSLPACRPGGDATIAEALAALPAAERTAAVADILKEAGADGFRGFGGRCAEAAVAINRALFGGRGAVTGGFNTFFRGHGRPIGHVAVAHDGVFWDADARPKTAVEIEKWGRLTLDDGYYAREAAKLGAVLTPELAAATELVAVADEAALLAVFGRHHLDGLLCTLRRAADAWLAARTASHRPTPDVTAAPAPR